MGMLFGEQAIAKGYLQGAQLAQALEEQERGGAQDGVNRFIGEILIELGFMTERQVLDVLNTLHARQPTA